MLKKKIRVLIIDDSALVRKILADGLGDDPEIEVVGQANDPFAARDLIKKLDPDVLTLDVEMPRMDGVEFLRRMMPVHPMPVLMVSSLTGKGGQITLDALEAGAIDFVTKPKADVSRGLSAMLDDLKAKLKAVAKTPVRKISATYREVDAAQKVQNNAALHQTTDKVIAIGASTGGTEALKDVLTRLPANSPGVVVVQHMPPGFTKMFADRLDKICQMNVKEAADQDRVMPGHILIAPGDYQMEVVRTGGVYRVRVFKGENVNGHCPSVGVLFDSVAKYAGNNAIGVMLTGMGKDGAKEMLNMKNSGAATIAQDKATCVVFGMPMEAYKLGAVDQLLPLPKIGDAIINLMNK